MRARKRTKVGITTAEKGKEAIRLVKDQDFDVIFLDHMMPDMDGIETLNLLKKETSVGVKNTPVICLTANAVSGAKEEYLAAGINNCGSLENYLDALKTTSETISDNISIIEAAMENEDWENYTIKVHAIKSSMRIIGSMGISTLAEGLEAAGNAKDINRIEKDTPELLSRLRILEKELCDVYKIKREDESNLPLIDLERLKEAYKGIAELASVYDADSIEFILGSFEGYQMPDEEKEGFDSVKRAFSNLDWDELSRLVMG